MKTKRGLLGFYNYTVVLTYLGMLVAFSGICFALDGRLLAAVICLMVAGLCDMFDGTIASTRPRCAAEKRFGIQIDSLCDLICFGVLPALLVGTVNGRSPLAMVICGGYVLCGLIRLAYFNVLEEERQEQTSERRKYYLGLPITTIALLLPVVFCLDRLCLIPFALSGLVLLVLAGVAFLLPVRIPKPHTVGQAIVVFLGVLEFGALMIGGS